MRKTNTLGLIALFLICWVLLPQELAATITQAEYFFNSADNGPGNNPPLLVSESNGIATATGTNLGLGGLGSGMHTIYSRLYDDQYGWGSKLGRLFLVTSTETEYEITAAEYYFDDLDNGPGQNTALSISMDNGVATATGANLATAGLGQGLHIVYCRMYADNFGWGAPRGYPLLVTGTSSSNTISAAEYFLDSDPGQGNGTALTLGGSDTEVSINHDFDLSNASPGLHSLFVRLYSPEAGWGPKTSAFFLVENPGLTYFIQSAQYFIGDSPESSEIITIDSPNDGGYDELNEAISLTDVSLPAGASGIQTVGIRFQRSDGEWGAWRTSTVFIETQDSVYTISGAEYFLDIDPGEGAGVSIAEPVDGVFDEMEEEFDQPVSVAGLSEGGHFAYLRLKRSDGTWGAPRGSYFIVSENAQPTIAGAEYYVNPATSEGNGIPFSPLDGAFNTTEESVRAIANMASLNAQEPGDYTLYVRYMNSRGEWGPVSSRPFTVQIRPQISTSSDTLDFGSLFTGDTRVLNLNISNIGDADLVVNSLEFSDNAYSSDWSSGTIPPLGNQSVSVTFAPLDPASSHPASLTIENNDAEKVIVLAGTGLNTAPVMSVLPDSLEFGTVHTIASATLSVRVNNSGNENLVISGITSTNSVFSGNVPNPTVIPEEYVDIDITFAPNTGDTYTDTAYIISNDAYFPAYPIYVSGTGSIIPVPNIQVSTEQLDFGNIELGNAPVSLSINVYNDGTETLNISNISIDESVFTSSITGAQVVNAASSLPINVTFNPTQSGRYSGEMVIYNDDPDSPEISVILSGSSVFPDMEIGIHNFAFGEVGVTASDFREFTIENVGSDTLKIESFSKSSDIDSVVNVTPESYNIAPDRSKTFVLHFAPAIPIEYAGMVVIHSNDENDTLYVTGSGLDDDPPVITFDPDDMENVGTTENSAITIFAPITDNNQISWVRLYYRQGGKTQYDSTEMVPRPGGYQGIIPAAYVRNRGVEYYIKAFDGANARVIPETAPDIPAIIRVRLPALPPFTFVAEEYGMISVPSDLDQKHVQSILEEELGEYDVNSWRLFRWINGSYVELLENDNFTFDPGNAYWLITGERQVITLDSSTSVKTNEDYLISLDQGWNQVGTPYYFPVSWSDVYAASPGVIQGSIAYEWVENEWQPASVMQPFGGYFISTPSGGSILRFPPIEAPVSSAKKALDPFALVENEWVLKVSAQDNDSRDLFNYIGVLDGAQTGLDIRDQPEPPGMYPDQVQLFSHLDEWGNNGGKFSGDFQAFSAEGNYWDLTLKTGESKSQTLISLAEMGEIPEAFNIRVLNLDLRYELAPNAEGQYVQRYFSNHATYRMRIAIGNDAFLAEHDEGIAVAPETFRLAQNFPNPFNGETRIQYDIPEPTGLRVVIYDMMGREVQELIRSDAHPVGYYEIGWNGVDDQGNRLASGIYLISFQSTDFQATRKMVLLK